MSAWWSAERTLPCVMCMLRIVRAPHHHRAAVLRTDSLLRRRATLTPEIMTYVHYA